MEEFLTPKEVAQIVKVSHQIVIYWIKQGKLKAFKIGGQWRIRKPDFEEFLQVKES